MRTRNFLLLLILFSFRAFAQEGLTEKNYRIYDTRLGKEVKLEDIVESMAQNNVLIYGEEHNDSVTHFLQNKLLSMLFARFGPDVALSMEMFDRDVQAVMNEYLQGFIREKNFKKDARTWSNYRDYRPMVEFAKEKKLSVICANAPSRYTNMAGRLGQESLQKLPRQTQQWLAPLPYDTAAGAYYEKLTGLSLHAPATVDTAKKKMPVMNMGNFNLVVAQSLWDATMAYSIASFWKANKKKKIFQLNGRFHSDERFAIVTQLSKYAPKAKVIVISSASDENFPNIRWSDYQKEGDYVIITDPSVPRTYKD
jgi:uncharacterized iron-regulated protein